jgi:hypothetical protein
MDDRTVRLALERHWNASDASDFDVEHDIYCEDAVLDYPQSGESIRGRRNIQESRFVQPNRKHFTVRRMIGRGDLWVTEFVLTYDGIPSYAVSIMEFREGLVAHETQYFADRFDPGPSRAHLVERMGESPGRTRISVDADAMSLQLGLLSSTTVPGPVSASLPPGYISDSPERPWPRPV